jgi:hypothetical protein
MPEELLEGKLNFEINKLLEATIYTHWVKEFCTR